MKWPSGFASAGVASGIKPSGLDLGCIAAGRAVTWAGVFTKNAAAAAPVGWCRARLGSPARAIVVNSGNANACTGSAGWELVADVARVAAGHLSCDPLEILVASTGPIGVPLALDPFDQGLPRALAELSDEPNGFATSILTTDTRTKTSSASVGEASVVGVAKGAAMIAPNMATMLAFIATDAVASHAELQEILSAAVEVSFNRISIDACESTNDSVFLLSSGVHPVGLAELSVAVRAVCSSLAEQIVADAEGATKIMRIRVTGATNDGAAAAIGKAVAASDLWRAAVAGADPNWGRVLSAAGGVEPDLDLSSIELSIGSAVVFSSGEPVLPLDVAAKEMEAADITVGLRIGGGPGTATILSADLTTEYVRLNSEVTT